MSVTLPPFRVYAQYRDKTKATEWYEIIPIIADQLCEGLFQIEQTYNIETQEGVQLDVIGRIVGQDRSYEAAIDFPGISWGNHAAANPQFGGAGMQFTGSGAVIQEKVSDAIYRLLLKSKICKNNGDATIESVLKCLSIILGINEIDLVDNEDMSFSMNVNFQLTPLQVFVLTTFDVVEKPQGVRFDGFADQDFITQWGGQHPWGGHDSQFGI